MSKKTFSEKEACVLLNSLVPGGGKQIRERLDSGESASDLTGRIREENLFGKRDALEELLRSFSPERETDLAAEKGIRILTRRDPDYPALLSKIYDPPIVLYVRGNLEPLDRAAFSIVGSRTAGFYGMDQSRYFARELAAGGLTIVSGLARGIDRAAHEGALQCAHGRTLAVLGCGADRIYPTENRALYERISEHGAVISELPLGAEPLRYHFPRRNRIIAGLSLGTLIVQASERSGSLITAQLALEEGRGVFALPGPVNDPLSRGALALVKDGATLVTSIEDIWEELAPALREVSAVVNTVIPEMQTDEAELFQAEKERNKFLKEEKHYLLDLLQKMPLTMDEMAEQLNMQLPSFSGDLLELEMKGWIQKTPEGRYKAAE